MRRGHFILIFFCLFVIMEWNYKTEKIVYEHAAEQKQRVEQAMKTAIDASADKLASVQGGQTKQTLEAFSEYFFRVFAMGMGWLEEPERWEELYFYVPALVVTQTEGFYIYSLQEVKLADGSAEWAGVWTECIPYLYIEGDLETQYFLDSEIENMQKKQSAIVRSLEEHITRVLYTQNEIAKQQGMTVCFRIPSFFDTFKASMEFPSVMAIYQGWPVSVDNKLLYHNCALSAAFLKEQLYVLVELSNRLEQPYAVMHQKKCEVIGKYGMVLEEYYTMEEALTCYGTYACPECMGKQSMVAPLS